ncbi:hypothetical protein BHM03_00055731 [Ensete ventricosum]|nr:hypothetical protein BHM03_00055731 [Ensete ventricosum]
MQCPSVLLEGQGHAPSQGRGLSWLDHGRPRDPMGQGGHDMSCHSLPPSQASCLGRIDRRDLISKLVRAGYAGYRCPASQSH